MSKLVYGVLGASVLVAVVSLASRVIEAQTPSGISFTCPSDAVCPCSQAATSQSVIWPPDHKMVPETIKLQGWSIVVTSIHQDEPIEALGSGNTEPDGVIDAIVPSTAYVRAERSGLGIGRLYVIEFRGTNVMTFGQCMGTVGVFVPHDQEQAHEISAALITDPGFTFPHTTLRCNSTAVGQAAEVCMP